MLEILGDRQKSLLKLMLKNKSGLTVDELSKAKKREDLGPSDLMRSLTSFGDKYYPSVCLAISAYGCVDVAKFAADSNRPLGLEPLPPLLPVDLEKKDFKLLPLVVQPFVRPEWRTHLPYKDSYLQGYAKLSRLLLMAGGHPHRLSVLMGVLRRFPGKFDVEQQPTPTEAKRWLTKC